MYFDYHWYNTPRHSFPPICSVLFSLFVASSNCPALEAPTHGKKFGSKYLAGHEVHFMCSSGYHLVGSATRVCQENGSWSGVSAFCKGLYLISSSLRRVLESTSSSFINPVSRISLRRNDGIYPSCSVAAKQESFSYPITLMSTYSVLKPSLINGMKF